MSAAVWLSALIGDAARSHGPKQRWGLEGPEGGPALIEERPGSSGEK
jgi:hypothetical protein